MKFENKTCSCRKRKCQHVFKKFDGISKNHEAICVLSNQTIFTVLLKVRVWTPFHFGASSVGRNGMGSTLNISRTVKMVWFESNCLTYRLIVKQNAIRIKIIHKIFEKKSKYLVIFKYSKGEAVCYIYGTLKKLLRR